MDLPSLIPVENTLDGQIGLEIGAHGDDWIEATVAVGDHVKQPMGLVHGGVYASIAESITSMATAVGVYADGMSAQGLSNSTNFLRPIFEGTIHARAERLHKGRTTWVWDVRITDDEGRLAAISRMVIAVRPLPD
ncbi:ComA operon protein 2 [Patulibacter medicamentivorans]|uniref:ComA operon protein 2 n=1 Tax=Patulibacter medicamentivorans TaxID=1097667 RepID=H0EBF6_9ACTN|nr:PaaI family thioesterase [Patulibacter medicamentivorans]EHN09032.1 ComA operon protein 2 [Patulibacter medicamentivorans]